ncbi:MAG: alpha/beta hydrolase [Planctomycetota bacterium]
MKPTLTTLICVQYAITGFCLAREMEGYTPDEVVVYKEIGDTKLTIDVFYPVGHRKTDARAAIVFFYAGGWAQGHPSQFHPQCKYLASRGLVAMTADYRVMKRDGTTPVECVKDAKSAIRWVRKNGADYGIDPNRLAAGGGSAGGHVAAAAAYLAGFNEQGEEISVSSIPSALILFSAVVDNSKDGFGYRHVKDYWREFSPLHNISNRPLPTIAFYGKDDKHTKRGLPEKLRMAVESAGGRCDLHLFEGQGHGFYNHKNPGFAATMTKTDEFFVSLGYLSGKPDLKTLKRIEGLVLNQSRAD